MSKNTSNPWWGELVSFTFFIINNVIFSNSTKAKNLELHQCIDKKHNLCQLLNFNKSVVIIPVSSKTSNFHCFR